MFEEFFDIFLRPLWYIDHPDILVRDELFLFSKNLSNKFLADVVNRWKIHLHDREMLMTFVGDLHASKR